jgi:hypothetical protein
MDLDLVVDIACAVDIDAGAAAHHKAPRRFDGLVSC